MTRTLILFDIDGTLVWRASREHAEAVVAGIHAVHGQQPLNVVDAAGQTDRAIVRMLLRDAGMDDAQIDAGMDEVLAFAAGHYETGCPADLSHTVIDGIPQLLGGLTAEPQLWSLGLVTGNIEQVARRKLTAAGLSAPLAPFTGAFGSDHEDRSALVPIAQQRAAVAAGGGQAVWPAERTIVVGDTPHDIACARAAGAAVIAVTTGAYEADALAAADAITSNAAELTAALNALRR
jgi:phosphoglycolate phosphatase